MPTQPLTNSFAPFPSSASLTDIYQSLVARTKVVGCLVGHKTTNGFSTGKPSIVVCVREKVPLGELHPRERIPRHVRWWGTATRYRNIATDVQVVGATGYQGSVVTGPGDYILSGSSTEPYCTMGVVIVHPDHGPLITSAGHGFQNHPGTIEYSGAGKPVRMANSGPTSLMFEGRLLKSSITDSADYALIQPNPPMGLLNAYQDFYAITGWRHATSTDIGAAVTALTSRGFHDTELIGVKAWLEIEGWPMRDLLLTPYVTHGGDSGCCLVDATYRVWGLLVGFAVVGGKTCSVFSSIHHTLSAEKADLL